MIAVTLSGLVNRASALMTFTPSRESALQICGAMPEITSRTWSFTTAKSSVYGQRNAIDGMLACNFAIFALKRL